MSPSPSMGPIKKRWRNVPTTHPQDGPSLPSLSTSPLIRAQSTVTTISTGIRAETDEWGSGSGSTTSIKGQEGTKLKLKHGRKRSYDGASLCVFEHLRRKRSKIDIESCDSSVEPKVSTASNSPVKILSESSIENTTTPIGDLCAFIEYTDSSLSDDSLGGYDTEYPVSEYEDDQVHEYSTEDRLLLRLFADEFGPTGLSRPEILSIMKGEEGRLDIFLYL